jgi:hypothetical protein
MTREEKITWLENAGAQEFLAHYNSQIRKFHRLSIMDPDFKEVMEDWTLTEAEMKRRLGI